MVSAGFPHGLKTAVFVIGMCLMMGCGFDAILKSAGPADVHFVFSDSIMALNDTVPLLVTVIAGGVAQAHPNLIVYAYNPNVIGVTSGDDSLIARRSGSDSINVRFQSALRPLAADTVLPIRVHP